VFHPDPIGNGKHHCGKDANPAIRKVCRNDAFTNTQKLISAPDQAI
jgi:hypothetical protein